MLPEPLRPTAHHTLDLGDAAVDVPLCRPVFARAAAVEGVHTFGGKPLVEVDGRAQFAEVAILRLFEAAGWQGRWVETYGNRKLMPAYWRAWQEAGPHAQVDVPIEEAWVNEKMHAIAFANGNTFSGCWDVVAWKEGRLCFAESKRLRHDRVRDTQLRWVRAALACGCAASDFLLVEWSLG